MTELHQLTIHQTRELLAKKQCSVVELTQSYLNRIQKLNPSLNAYLTVSSDVALSQARDIDARLARGETIGALAGVPLAPKDIYLTKGIETTCASRILKGFIPPYNSTVIDRCLQHGAVILGKTNLDEFAMGSSNENSAFGVARNPWNTECTPGGSSGGSAAAVAGDLCAASLGTDTGGSIRQPAAFCGIVGLKPTYGRVSRYGTIAFASSLDQMGPMTKDVRDAAILLEVMSGHDQKDSTSIDHPVESYTQSLGQSIRGLRVGVPKEFFTDAIHPDVSTAVQKAIKELENLGAEIIQIQLPHTRYAVATYYIIAPAEASANLSRYDGVRFGLREPAQNLNQMYQKTRSAGFGDEVKRRILIGTYVLSSGYYDAYYIKAQKARTRIREDYLTAFKSVDVIVGPVTPTTAFRIGEKSSDPLEMYLSDILTISANLAGLPAMSLPCGFDMSSLPIGLQLIGKPFDEATLLKMAYAYEQSQVWSQKKPSL